MASARRATVLVGATGAALLAFRRRYRNWGATPGEVAARLPGDELVPGPARTTTRAVTVDAPAAEVWPWLAQIGQDRGGLYSYDLVENLIGLGIHSAGEVRPEWELRVGDRVRLVRPEWMGMPAGLSLPVVMIDPGRSLVLREAPPEHPWDAVWSFHLVPAGAGSCRLISRGRSATRGGVPGRVQGLLEELSDPVTLLMTRRMLLGIKCRAETRYHVHRLAA